MLELSRCVRFCISLVDSDLAPADAAPGNTFAAWPGTADLGAFYELQVRCQGSADPVTGYLMSISRIDEAVRTRAVPLIQDEVRSPSPRPPALILQEILAVLRSALNGAVHSVTWKLTPFHRITMESEAMDRFSLSQQFEFAAAHRLHCPELSDEENRRVFGRCNNPHGHGHNYRLEVTASAPLPSADGRPTFSLPDLEGIVAEQVIQRFDHTHLNLDTAEFADLNPSVEHIARVCHDLLAAPIAAAGAALEHVTVWETEKTSCTYPAGRHRP